MKPEWKFRGELNGISEEVQSILTGRGATWDIKKGHQEEEFRGKSARSLEEEVKFLHVNSDNFKGGK